MTAALGSTLVAVLLLAVALAGLALVTLVPLLAAVTSAERRGYGAARWVVLQALASALALGLLVPSLRGGPRAVLVLVAVAVAWAPPAVLRLPVVLPGAGARGRHE